MSSRFYSSLTKKYVMSLAGLFLITFLLVHLTINLLILLNDSSVLFNQAAHFMGMTMMVIFAMVIITSTCQKTSSTLRSV